MREMAELCRILLPANPDLEVANCHVVVSGSTQLQVLALGPHVDNPFGAGTHTVLLCATTCHDVVCAVCDLLTANIRDDALHQQCYTTRFWQRGCHNGIVEQYCVSDDRNALPDKPDTDSEWSYCSDSEASDSDEDSGSEDAGINDGRAPVDHTAGIQITGMVEPPMSPNDTELHSMATLRTHYRSLASAVNVLTGHAEETESSFIVNMVAIAVDCGWSAAWAACEICSHYNKKRGAAVVAPESPLTIGGAVLQLMPALSDKRRLTIANCGVTTRGMQLLVTAAELNPKWPFGERPDAVALQAKLLGERSCKQPQEVASQHVMNAVTFLRSQKSVKIKRDLVTVLARLFTKLPSAMGDMTDADRSKLTSALQSEAKKYNAKRSRGVLHVQASADGVPCCERLDWVGSGVQALHTHDVYDNMNCLLHHLLSTCDNVISFHKGLQNALGVFPRGRDSYFKRHGTRALFYGVNQWKMRVRQFRVVRKVESDAAATAKVSKLLASVKKRDATDDDWLVGILNDGTNSKHTDGRRLQGRLDEEQTQILVDILRRGLVGNATAACGKRYGPAVAMASLSQCQQQSFHTDLWESVILALEDGHSIILKDGDNGKPTRVELNKGDVFWFGGEVEHAGPPLNEQSTANENDRFCWRVHIYILKDGEQTTNSTSARSVPSEFELASKLPKYHGNGNFHLPDAIANAAPSTLQATTVARKLRSTRLTDRGGTVGVVRQSALEAVYTSSLGLNCLLHSTAPDDQQTRPFESLRPFKDTGAEPMLRVAVKTKVLDLEKTGKLKKRDETGSYEAYLESYVRSSAVLPQTPVCVQAVAALRNVRIVVVDDHGIEV